MKEFAFTIHKGEHTLQICVKYDPKQPENYEVTGAYHNGIDVTEFYQMCEAEKETLFCYDIITAIAEDICTKRVDSGIWNGSNHLNKTAA